jgi:hypothetical protein
MSCTCVVGGFIFSGGHFFLRTTTLKIEKINLSDHSLSKKDYTTRRSTVS